MRIENVPSTGSGNGMRSENVPSTTLRQRVIEELVISTGSGSESNTGDFMNFVRRSSVCAQSPRVEINIKGG